MNRLTAAGIAAAAQAGDRVLVVTTARECRPAFDEVTRTLSSEVIAHVSRVAGSHSIFLKNGGWVRFRTAYSVRGHAADVVYLDESVQDHPGLADEVRPCVAASLRGEIIRL